MRKIGILTSCIAGMLTIAETARAMDCNDNGTSDATDILGGTSADCDLNRLPDECDIVPRQVAKLLASDSAETDEFGRAIAVEADMALITSYRDDNFGNDSGSAYVFRRISNDPNQLNEDAWQQVDKFFPADGNGADRFGQAMAMDVPWAIFGAQGDDDAANQAGSAYFYQYVNDAWTLDGKVLASDADTNDRFGTSVDIEQDRAIVGAFGNADAGVETGAAYVFERIDGSWTETAKLLAPDGAPQDWFGHAVVLEGDLIVVGTPFHDATTNNLGAAYLYVNSNGTWHFHQKLQPSDPVAGALFGYALCATADEIFIGAHVAHGATPQAGAVYVFASSNGVWTQREKLFADDGLPGDSFGFAVAADGVVLSVGARADDDGGDNAGTGYLFHRTPGGWMQEYKVISHDIAPFDDFGVSTTISGDTVFIGARSNDDAGNKSGAVYVFDLTDVNFNDLLDDCEFRGDFDRDGDIDADDLAAFDLCIAGPPEAPAPPPPFTPADCLIAFDFDVDRNIDLADFQSFQLAWSSDPPTPSP